MASSCSYGSPFATAGHPTTIQPSAAASQAVGRKKRSTGLVAYASPRRTQCCCLAIHDIDDGPSTSAACHPMQAHMVGSGKSLYRPHRRHNRLCVHAASQHNQASMSASRTSGATDNRRMGNRSLAAAKRLTKNISSAQTLPQLRSAYEKSAQQLNHVHVSAILSKLVQFSRTDPNSWQRQPSTVAGQDALASAAGQDKRAPSADTVISMDDDDVYDIRQQDYDDDYSYGSIDFDDASRAAHSLAGGTSSSMRGARLSEQGFGVPGKRQGQRGRRSMVARAGVSYIANTLQPAHQLGRMVEDVVQAANRVAHEFDLQTLSMTLTSLAKLRYRNPSSMAGLMVRAQQVLAEGPNGKSQQLQLPPKQQQKQQQQQAAALRRSQLGAQAGKRGSSNPPAPPQNPVAIALVNLMWACSMLEVAPPVGWSGAVQACIEQHLDNLRAQDVATLAYALGALGTRPQAEWMSSFCATAARVLPDMRPIDLCNTMAGFASIRYLPDDKWMVQYLSVCQPKLQQFNAGELVRLMTALASVGCRPSDTWLKTFYDAIWDLPENTGVPLNTQQVAAVLPALARLGCRPQISWMNECLMRSRRSLPSASSLELSQLVTALAQLRFRAGEAWMQDLLSAAFLRLAYCTPAECCSMLQALLRLGHRPPPRWLDEMVSKVQGRLPLFTGPQLADLVGCLGRLGYKPHAAWMAEFERCSSEKLVCCSSQGLTTTVWALAEMKHQPQVSWLYSFVLAAYSHLDSFNATQLSTIFEALPHISPHPTWLDELVQICASESSMFIRGKPMAGPAAGSKATQVLRRDRITSEVAVRPGQYRREPQGRGSSKASRAANRVPVQEQQKPGQQVYANGMELNGTAALSAQSPPSASMPASASTPVSQVPADALTSQGPMGTMNVLSMPLTGSDSSATAYVSAVCYQTGEAGSMAFKRPGQTQSAGAAGKEAGEGEAGRGMEFALRAAPTRSASAEPCTPKAAPLPDLSNLASLTPAPGAPLMALG